MALIVENHLFQDDDRYLLYEVTAQPYIRTPAGFVVARRNRFLVDTGIVNIVNITACV